MRIVRRVVIGLLVVFGVYLVGRAAAEPFVIDLADPSSYAHDWGGPHLVGVMAVHMAPGLLSLSALSWWFGRWRTRRREHGGSDQPWSTPVPARRVP